MPHLGDYLGQLLAEITIARVHADLESLRVAELYASHPHLRNFPVPHFRLPDVELDLPVVIRQMDEPKPGESARGGLDAKKLRATFDKILTAKLEAEGITLTQRRKRELKSSLDRKGLEISAPAEIAVDVSRAADEFAKVALEIVGATLEPEKKRELQASIRAEVRTEFLKLRQPPPRLHSLVTTAEVREAGPGETVTRIKLKLTEEGVEWTTIESEDGPRDRLAPE